LDLGDIKYKGAPVTAVGKAEREIIFFRSRLARSEAPIACIKVL
jgi:hypothetical protein